MGVVVFVGSIVLTLLNVLSGSSDFTRVERNADKTPKLYSYSNEGVIGAACANANGEGCTNAGWKPQDGDIPIWIQLAIFIPLSNIVMGYLEGSQIAILALEKAPAKTIKRLHRSAYFGHKLSQQRDNVRRYLLGRQFLVVFVDFIAAHSMGLGGLGILVPVSQLYPQLLGASNPMWFMGTWGSKGVLLLALIMEFTGLCHFSWGLFSVFIFIRSFAIKGDEKADVGSVGQEVDISGGAGITAEDEEAVDDIGALQRIVIEQQHKIELLERTLNESGQAGDGNQT